VTLSFEETDLALSSGIVGRARDRDVVWVEGPNAHTYLQGQVTQDLDPLTNGGGVEALLLSPQGKIDAYVRVVREGEERFGVEVAEGFGGRVLERLGRFKIRVKANLELVTTRLVEVRGPLATLDVPSTEGVLVLPYRFGVLFGYDLLGDAAAIPDGVAVGDDGAFEVARILSGIPALDRELTDKTIPAEAGIVERTISFTKGCYTGQELVARLDARGNRVPWNLRSVRAAGRVAIEDGSALFVNGDEVGRVTSSAYSPLLDLTVALGYLKRSFEVPGPVVVRSAGTDVTADVIALGSALA
jgi:folate-binding protein YgfZ